MATRMQQRRGTESQWTASNPILNIGEIGFESDNNKFKIGDGTNHWADLPYFLDEDTIGTSLNGYLEDTLLGANNGVAQLNSSGKLVSTQIPNVDEITQDAINTALVAGTGLDKTYDDNGNTITLDIDSTVATLTGTQTLTNKTLTSPVVNTPTGITKSDVGLANVDNTTDANKPVSTATQTALDLKANSSDITELAQDAVNTAIVAGTGLDKTYDDAANTITIDIDSTVVTLNGSQTLTNKTITSPSGLVKGDVGLGNVDNTSDANKPVSTATQTALDLKIASATAASTYAPLASPTFTGTVAGVTKTHVGLGNVDNTADADKPVSTATQTALDAKAPLASPALTGTPTAPTATAGTNTTQVATTAYADAAVAALVASAPSTLNTLNELATALGNDASFSTTLTNSIALKAPLASPTFTGAVDFTGATVTGISSYNAPTLGSTSIASGATVTTVAGLTLTAPTLTGTVTVSGDINLSAANGPGSLLDELALMLMGAL